MRLLLQIGYVKLLLPKDCDATAIFNAFDGIRNVEERGYYGEDYKIILKDEEQISLKLIKPESIQEEEKGE